MDYTVKICIMKYFLTALLSCIGLAEISAQIVNPSAVLKRKVEGRINNKIDDGIDKGLDKIEKDAQNAGRDSGSSEGSGSQSKSNTGAGSGNAASNKTVSLVSYSKFDFIPGEKLLVKEDFASTSIGDFPINWNTNSTGEIVNVEGSPEKWFSISKEGTFLQEDVTTLPENFTYQFNLMCNPEFSYYSSSLNLVFANMTNPSSEFMKWKNFSHPGNAVTLQFHPTDAGGGVGTVGYILYTKGTETMKNSVTTSKFHAKTSNSVKVSIWRQKTRLRVYINDEKVLDLPKAFSSDVIYNSSVFWLGGTHQTIDRYLISDIRLAVGAPDTRNKLITEGKFVTLGILFDSGSDKIKPESYGTLKEIATVLKDNPEVRVNIVGHTDSDGETAANQKLSEKRAEAIKSALNTDFSIDKSRMETIGKGESEPAEPNTSEKGKASNRRVEFIKIN